MLIEISAYLNIVGLIFDIVGVLLVFRFAMPPGMYSEGHSLVTYPKGEHKPKVTSVETLQRRAVQGLWLIVIGFTLQAIGNTTVFWIGTN